VSPSWFILYYLSDLKKPAGPLLKWVGGKKQLLGPILKAAPQSFNRYHEPFLGGGALFFALSPSAASLADLNPRLMNFYSQVSRDHLGLQKEVEAIADVFASGSSENKAQFLSLREEFNALGDSRGVRSAALLLVLNKTCFNGLFRENASGAFNVPFNHFTAVPRFFDANTMSSSSEALCKAELSVSSFHEVLNRAVSNDFIYLDPPYVPLSPTADFSSYTASGFNETLHNELLDVSKELRSRGAYVMVSNSYSPWVIENYEKAGFRVNPIAASRNVAAKASSRRRVQEALIFGY